MSDFVNSKGIHLVYTYIGHRERLCNSILIVGHDQMTVGHDQTTVGHDQMTVGHDQTPVGHDQTNVGHDQTTLQLNYNCWS